MSRMFRGRASIKASDLVALFILSMFGTMTLCIIFALLHDFMEHFFPSSS
jgi:hypothetical protein